MREQLSIAEQRSLDKLRTGKRRQMRYKDDRGGDIRIKMINERETISDDDEELANIDLRRIRRLSDLPE